MAEPEPTRPKKPGPKPGGKRGGMVKGQILPKTIAKEEAKAILREMIIAELRPIVRAQIKSAVGVDHMMLRDEETGQFRRLTELGDIERALNAPNAHEGSTYWIHTKDPNNQAAADLLNRAIGKPTEEVQIEHTGSVGFYKRLDMGRKRAAGS